MQFIVTLISFLIFVGCSSEEITPKPKEPTKPKEVNETKEPKEPKKEIEVLSQEEKFLLNLDKEQKVIYQYLKLYLSSLTTLDSDTIVQLTYPKLFLVFDKNTFRRQIITMANSSQITIQSFDTKNIEIGEIQNFSKGSFAKIAYTSIITLHLTNPNLYNTTSSINTLYSILVRKYGREEIYVDVENRLVRITKKVKMLAIKESPNSWKFIGDTPEYRTLYPSFIPYEILNQI